MPIKTKPVKIKSVLLQRFFIKQFFAVLCVLTTQASCSNSEDTAEFNLSKAEQRWSSAEKNWNEDELRALEQGNAIYRKNCAACHGKTGNGDATIGAPSLLNNAVIKGDVNYHIALIRNGKNQMPAFLQVLTDDEILHVAAFERNAWGNHDFSIFDRTGD